MLLGKLNIDDNTIKEIVDWYQEHSLQSTSKRFGISAYHLRKLLTSLDVPLLSSSEAIKRGAKESRQNLVSKELFQEYYETHTEKELAEHFNLSLPMVARLMQEYQIEKRSQAESIKMGMQKKYGVDNAMQLPTSKQKAKDTCLERYGVEYAAQSQQFKDQVAETCMQKYGVTSTAAIPERRERAQQTMLERYGVGKPEIVAKTRQTIMERYGVSSPLKDPVLLDKLRQTCMEKYGVPYHCMTPEARNFSNNKSRPNLAFAAMLEQEGIEYITEFTLGDYSYDFKVGGTLVEINPSSTHNSTWTPFGDHAGIDKYYHQKKSKYASDHGYRCIHIWEWDPVSIIISSLKPSPVIYGRKCEVREISQEEASTFINRYHYQGWARASVSIALVHNDEIVSVMTFGKPRYNKKMEWELVRYCSSSRVIGGASKLFQYFVKKWNPSSVVSYCDLSKFNGNIYEKLGFRKGKYPQPSKHWYNFKTHRHITDNLLRQQGFDRLLGQDYGVFGKGTSNEQLMLDHQFVEIYDAGQQSYYWIP